MAQDDVPKRFFDLIAGKLYFNSVKTFLYIPKSVGEKGLHCDFYAFPVGRLEGEEMLEPNYLFGCNNQIVSEEDLKRIPKESELGKKLSLTSSK